MAARCAKEYFAVLTNSLNSDRQRCCAARAYTSAPPTLPLWLPRLLSAATACEGTGCVLRCGIFKAPDSRVSTAALDMAARVAPKRVLHWRARPTRLCSQSRSSARWRSQVSLIVSFECDLLCFICTCWPHTYLARNPRFVAPRCASRVCLCTELAVWCLTVSCNSHAGFYQLAAAARSQTRAQVLSTDRSARTEHGAAFQVRLWHRGSWFVQATPPPNTVVALRQQQTWSSMLACPTRDG